MEIHGLGAKSATDDAKISADGEIPRSTAFPGQTEMVNNNVGKLLSRAGASEFHSDQKAKFRKMDPNQIISNLV